jgi:LysM repeat protein
MKRVIILLSLLLAAPLVRGQDSAGGPSRQELNENIKVLEGRINVALEGKAAQDKQLQNLAKQVEDLRVQASKPSPSYATKDDLKELADKIQEIDKKRQEDKELILKEIKKLGTTLAAASTAPSKNTGTGSKTTANPPADDPPKTDHTSQKSDEGYWYTIQSGDTYNKIAAYYRGQGIKVTSDEIAKANPTVPETKLYVDRKIFVPAPKPVQSAKQ